MHQVQIISTIFISVFCFIGGLFALLSNYHRRPNRLVFYLTLATALSLPAQGIFAYTDPGNVVLWSRIDTSTTIILDALTVLLACNFPRRLFGYKTEIAFMVVSTIFAIISFSPFMIANGTSDGQTVQLTTGALMPLYYVVDGLYTFLILPALIVQYRRGRKIDKLRIKYLILGVGGIGLLTSIVGLWLPIFFHIYEAANFVPLAILIGGAFIMYDVVALRLLSIRLVVARSVAYILLLLAIAGGYYFFALWIGQNIFGLAQISEVGQLYQIGIAFALAFLFQPIRTFFEKLTDRIFYKNHYDTQKVVNGFTNILVTERDIEPLLQRSIAYLCSQLHISSGEIVVYDKGALFATSSCNGKQVDATTIDALRKFNGSILISEYLADEDPNRALMEQAGVWAAAKLTSQNDDVGILLLGDKLSGDIYSNQDIGALEIISQALAVAVQNARAYRLLQDAEAQLKKTDEMKSEFIALASHNLRTPAGTVRMISEMLSSAKTPKEISEYTKMLSETSKTLGDLVEELLAISQLEAGERYESFQIVPVDAILQIVAPAAEQAAKAKNLTFNISEQNHNLQIRANKERLCMAIESILDNAVKFTNSGKIDVTVKQEDEECVIAIADTGVGISEDEVKNLFTKFHRGTDFKRYNYAGVGISLYLVQLVVKEHGGQIFVTSELQKGTTVTIRLPLAKP